MDLFKVLSFCVIMTLYSGSLSAQEDKLFEYTDSTFEVGSVHLLPFVYCEVGHGDYEGYGICSSINLTILSEFSSFASKHPGLYFQIECHTDTRGSAYSNKQLSEKRATILSVELAREYKIDLSRLKTVGYGESKPLVSDQYIHQMSIHQSTECMREEIHAAIRRILIRIVGIDR